MAAVALPQYQIAVKKAQLARYISFVKTLVQTQEAYYLANGEYTSDLTALDVELPISNCTLHKNKTYGYYECSDITYGVWDGPSNAQVITQDIGYIQFFDDCNNYYHAKKGDIMCFSNSDVSRRACRTLGAGTEEEHPSGDWMYMFKLEK